MLDINAPQGEIKNLKFRKEGKGENGAVPLDIAIVLTCAGATPLRTLIGGNNAATFWRANDDKDLMYPYLGMCESTAKVRYCTVEIDMVILKNCDLSKFKFKCLGGGMIELAFNCAAKEFSEHDVSDLRALLQDVAQIKVSGGDLVDKMNDPDPEPDDDEDQNDLDLDDEPSGVH